MTKYAFLLSSLSIFTNLKGQSISNFPYIQNYENQTICSSSPAAPCFIDVPLWENATDDDIDWTAYNQPTPTGSTGPSGDHTTGSGIFLYLESSTNGLGYPNKTAHLHSPYFDFTALASPRLRFWYHVFGFNMGELYVDARQGSAGIWTAIAGPLTGDLDLWQVQETNLTAYAGMDSVQFRFRGVTGTGFYSDMAIDDVEVFGATAQDVYPSGVSGLPLSGCGLGVYPVSLRILNNGSNTLPAGTVLGVGFVAGNQQVQETLNLPADLPSGDSVLYAFNAQLDLSAPGAYEPYFYVAFGGDMLPGNDTLRLHPIDHIPVIGQFPYYQDFEQNRGGWTAFNAQGGALNGSWAYGYPSKRSIVGAASGSKAWATGGLGTTPYNAGEQSWVLGPAFDLSALCQPWLELAVWWASEYEWDGASLQVSLDTGATWQTLGAVASSPNHWYNTPNIAAQPGGQAAGWSGGGAFTGNGSEGWLRARHSLAAFAGNASVQLRIAFAADAVYQDDGFAFDDVRLYDGVDLWFASAPPLLCSPGDTVVLDAGGQSGYAYLWNTGSTDSVLAVSAPGSYSVTVSDGACTASDTVFVLQGAPPALLLPDSAAACVLYSIDATALGASFYAWSNGATTPIQTVTFAGYYSVTATDALGCSATDSVWVDIFLASYLYLGEDTTACYGLTLDADPDFVDYQWSNGAVGAQITVHQSGTYVLSASNSDGCISTDSIEITIENPSIDLGADTVICQDMQIVLSAGGQPGDYLWSNGSTASSITVGAGSYSVTLTTPAGCTASDQIEISETICSGTLETEQGLGTLSLFPNPASQYLQLRPDFDDQNLSLVFYNALGQKLQVHRLEGIEAGSVLSFSVDWLPSGSYWLDWIGEKGRRRLSFAIIRY